MMHDRLDEIVEKELAAAQDTTHTVRVCVAAGCLSSQSAEVKAALAAGEQHGCRVKGVGCLGLCSQGPLVAVDAHTADGETQTTLYQNVIPADAPDILAALDGPPLARLASRKSRAASTTSTSAAPGSLSKST